MFLVVFSVEQAHGIYAGLSISKQIASSLFSGAFFPIVILILVYALFWFGMQISQGRKGLLSALVYMVVASIVLYGIRSVGGVPVRHYLLYQKSGTKYVGVKTNLSGEEELTYNSPNPQFSTKTVSRTAPLVVDVLSLFDPLIVAIYKAGVVIEQTNLINLNREKCANVETLLKASLVYPLQQALKKTTGQEVKADCLAKYVKATRDALAKASTLPKEETSSSEETISKVWRRVFPTNTNEQGDVLGEVYGAFGMTMSAGGDCAPTSEWYWTTVGEGVNYVLQKCKQIDHNYNVQNTRRALEEFAVKDGTKSINKLLQTIEPQVGGIMNSLSNPSGGDLRGAISSMITKLSGFLDRNFRFNFRTNFKLLNEAQGTVLAILISLAPIVFLVSLIPVGDSMINVRIIAGYLIAFFLVNLWVPVLYIIYLVVWGRATLSVLSV